MTKKAVGEVNTLPFSDFAEFKISLSLDFCIFSLLQAAFYPLWQNGHVVYMVEDEGMG